MPMATIRWPGVRPRARRTGSHSTERVASARRLVRDCFATDPVFRGRERSPGRAYPCQSKCRIGAAKRPAPLVAASRHRVRRFSPNDCVGAVPCGLTLWPPPSAERGRLRPISRSRRVWAQPRRSAKHMRQAVDRDHQNVVLEALDARTRTRHMMPRAPLRAHLRRRRDSHAACSRTRARWRSSYVLVVVSIATAIPFGEIATESMSPRPCHGNECRSRHPSVSSGVSARCTSCSERAPTRLRPASASQWRA